VICLDRDLGKSPLTLGNTHHIVLLREDRAPELNTNNPEVSSLRSTVRKVPRAKRPSSKENSLALGTWNLALIKLVERGGTIF
jgi:hypothetical protein